jgi:hypothetical protein
LDENHFVRQPTSIAFALKHLDLLQLVKVRAGDEIFGCQQVLEIGPSRTEFPSNLIGRCLVSHTGDGAAAARFDHHIDSPIVIRKSLRSIQHFCILIDDLVESSFDDSPDLLAKVRVPHSRRKVSPERDFIELQFEPRKLGGAP